LLTIFRTLDAGGSSRRTRRLRHRLAMGRTPRLPFPSIFISAALKIPPHGPTLRSYVVRYLTNSQHLLTLKFHVSGACGIMLGYKFRMSTFLFGLPYWYILLLDKSFWNNHSYLFGIVTMLLMGSSANHYL
jgi:hypothetical protein